MCKFFRNYFQFRAKKTALSAYFYMVSKRHVLGAANFSTFQYFNISISTLRPALRSLRRRLPPRPRERGLGGEATVSCKCICSYCRAAEEIAAPHPCTLAPLHPCIKYIRFCNLASQKENNNFYLYIILY